MKDKSKTQKEYEITLLLPPVLKDKEISEITQKTKEWIKELEGTPLSEEITKRQLAYPINKYQQGFYLSLGFLLEPKNLPQLEEKLRLAENILRFLIVQRLTKKQPVSQTTKPSTSSKPKETKTAPQKSEEIKEEKTQTPKKPIQEKAQIEELDKKLEEILGEEI